ncbi:MAG: SWIM zinc finger family protein [Armatimonadetes bacterium]|nr:SWIM zinc finger family protein [Armatimonadota bacterium]
MSERIQAHARRRATAQKARGDYHIELQEDGTFRVEKADGTAYVVNLAEETCTCPDFRQRLARREAYAGVWCKHLHLCAASFLR